MSQDIGELHLFGTARTRSTRCTWALEEAGLSYRYTHVDLRSGEGRSPAYLAMNPGGKVPTLLHGEHTITESGAICSYAGDLVPTSGLVPRPGTAERALYDRWMFFVIGELEQPLWTMGKHRFALPKAHRVPAVLDTARWEFAVAARVLAKGLGERDFLVAGRFTFADLMTAHTLRWAQRFELPLQSLALESFVDRHMGRPALQLAAAREDLAKAAAAP